LGGLALTSAAGCINAVGFLSLDHHAISHMSGNVTVLGLELGRADYAGAMRTLTVLLCFFFGCLLSGLIIRESTLRLGRRYGVALACESTLLVFATWYLRHGQHLGVYLAAMACGLQNAMATGYSGAVVRTTHMTGIVTDLGIAVGLWARRQPVDWRRMRLYLVLLLGFFVGSGLGAVGFAHFHYDTLLFPAALTGFGGIVYGVYKHRTRRAGPH
jgi:uncharacterized membrane protein YoaK (UPF0700 family)